MHSTYNAYITSNMKELPNVSYCENYNEIHYNPYVDPRIFATVIQKEGAENEGVYDLISPVRLSLFSKLEIDGVTQPSVVATYDFGDTNEHQVAYTLVDPTTIGNRAFHSAYINSITIPPTVTTIGDLSLSLLYNLTNLVIPDTVTTIIQSSITSNANLTDITIGSGVTSIGNAAFGFDDSLVNFTIKAVTPPTAGEAMFYECDNLSKIYVPAESVNAYKAASGWSTYASKIEAIPNR